MTDSNKRTTEIEAAQILKISQNLFLGLYDFSTIWLFSSSDNKSSVSTPKTSAIFLIFSSVGKTVPLSYLVIRVRETYILDAKSS